ncbi:MAG: ABC transporter substrate-binding protein, partial [Pseudomonadota bacterium]|nr:ABC transporter substrate-binding protein [Pseudomonadota bacterium]
MMPLGAAAETTSIRFQLDWRFEGPAAPFLMAAEKGYFAEEGLQVQIDSGSGSAGAVNRVASGAYEMGFGDLNALVEFLAENPEGPGIKGVYIVYDGTPAAVFARKESGIESPA